MSQPYPPQQPYGYGTPPPPPKKTNVGKIIGLGCAGIIGLFILIGIIGALASSDDSSKNDTATTAESSAPAAQETPAPKQTAEKKEPSPVAVTAKNTKFAKTLFADGSDYTSVLVTIANNGGETIDVNPLYITITDTAGTKHTAELAVDDNQIDTVKLAPGENVSGTVTGKGKFTAKYVTYTDGLIGESVRANVS
jgi:hypothetical protein